MQSAEFCISAFELGAAGRILACIVPLRRRMPHKFGHGSEQKWINGVLDWWINGKNGLSKICLVHSAFSLLHFREVAHPAGLEPATL